VITAVAPYASLRQYAPATPSAASGGDLLKKAGAGVGGGIVAASTGSIAASLGSVATVPVAEAVLNGYPTVGSLFGLLHFAIFTQMGTTAAIAGTAALGVAAGVLATQAAPAAPGAIRAYLEKPAAALRDFLPRVDASATRKEAAKAGACAGYHVGKSFGTLAGGIQGAFSGYSLGLLASGLVTASLPLGIAGAIGGAALGAATLGLLGRYTGGALGAGLGAAMGAAAYEPKPQPATP